MSDSVVKEESGMADAKQVEAIDANRQPVAADFIRRCASDTATVGPTFEERLR